MVAEPVPPEPDSPSAKSMAPPSPASGRPEESAWFAEFPVSVVPVRLSVAVPPKSAASIAPPLISAELLVKVELVSVSVPAPASPTSMAPPSPPAELPINDVFSVVTVDEPPVSPLSIAPPLAPAESLLNVE